LREFQSSALGFFALPIQEETETGELSSLSPISAANQYLLPLMKRADFEPKMLTSP
jgi:hypothetical protein